MSTTQYVGTVSRASKSVVTDLRSSAGSAGASFRTARLGRRVPSPATSCGSDLRIARLGRRVPRPATSCGPPCVLGGGFGRAVVTLFPPHPPGNKPTRLPLTLEGDSALRPRRSHPARG